jgi:hypothetical protein
MMALPTMRRPGCPLPAPFTAGCSHTPPPAPGRGTHKAGVCGPLFVDEGAASGDSETASRRPMRRPLSLRRSVEAGTRLNLEGPSRGLVNIPLQLSRTLGAGCHWALWHWGARAPHAQWQSGTVGDCGQRLREVRYIIRHHRVKVVRHAECSSRKKQGSGPACFSFFISHQTARKCTLKNKT